MDKAARYFDENSTPAERLSTYRLQVAELEWFLNNERQHADALAHALRFYAEMQNHPREIAVTTLIDQDWGQKAINALAAHDKRRAG